MQGHHQLIETRRNGNRPGRGVWIWVSKYPQHETANTLGNEWHEVIIRPDESVDRLDLRYVFGLPVIVSSEDVEDLQRSVRAVCSACLLAGAVRVVGFETRRGRVGDMIPPEESWLYNYTRE